MAALLLYVIGGSFVWSESYANRTETGNRLAAPLNDPFGTDAVGRDVLAHPSTVADIVADRRLGGVGVPHFRRWSAFSGYYGGIIDSVLMRFTEAMFSIPSLFF